MRQHVLDLSRSELETYLAGIKQPRYRVEQIYKGIFVKNWDRFELFTTLPKELRSRLRAQFSLRSLP
jgi:adenine C2-methylase RlmN of 23S rRNA A2503 and tRNA A37